jgi:hypothetical protein
MKIAVGQRWQYVDKISNFIGEVMTTSPSIKVKIVHVYKAGGSYGTVGIIFDSSCLEYRESPGSFGNPDGFWSWTYLHNQDAIKD